jgi:hypothetical protein
VDELCLVWSGRLLFNQCRDQVTMFMFPIRKLPQHKRVITDVKFSSMLLIGVEGRNITISIKDSQFCVGESGDSFKARIPKFEELRFEIETFSQKGLTF